MVSDSASGEDSENADDIEVEVVEGLGWMCWFCLRVLRRVCTPFVSDVVAAAVSCMLFLWEVPRGEAEEETVVELGMGMVLPKCGLSSMCCMCMFMLLAVRLVAGELMVPLLLPRAMETAGSNGLPAPGAELRRGMLLASTMSMSIPFRSMLPEKLKLESSKYDMY